MIQQKHITTKPGRRANNCYRIQIEREYRKKETNCSPSGEKSKVLVLRLRKPFLTLIPILPRMVGETEGGFPRMIRVKG